MKSNHTVWPGCLGILFSMLLGGCSGLLPPPLPPENIYLLEGTASPAVASPAAGTEVTGSASGQSRQVLAVSMPRARPGFDTDQMVWLRQPYKLEVYARNRWADTPAHMLAPLLVQALGHAGTFQAVVMAPSVATPTLRLDTEVIRLQQDFSVHPSRVQLTLGLQLIDLGTRRVLASTVLDESENAGSEDAAGGVAAANRALQRLLPRVVEFCAAHVPQ